MKVHSPNDGVKQLAAAVVKQAYEDMKAGGIMGNKAVNEVKAGGLDM